MSSIIVAIETLPRRRDRIKKPYRSEGYWRGGSRHGFLCLSVRRFVNSCYFTCFVPHVSRGCVTDRRMQRTRIFRVAETYLLEKALNPLFTKNREKMLLAFQKIYVLVAGLVMKKMHYLMLYMAIWTTFKIGMQELIILLIKQFLHHSMMMFTVSIKTLLTDTSRTLMVHPSILFPTSVQTPLTPL